MKSKCLKGKEWTESVYEVLTVIQKREDVDSGIKRVHIVYIYEDCTKGFKLDVYEV